MQARWHPSGCGTPAEILHSRRAALVHPSGAAPPGTPGVGTSLLGRGSRTAPLATPGCLCYQEGARFQNLGLEFFGRRWGRWCRLTEATRRGLALGEGIAAFMEKLRAFLVRGEQRVIGGAMIVGPETSGTWPLKVEQDRQIWAGTPVRPYKCSIVFIANCVMGRGLSKGFMIE